MSNHNSNRMKAPYRFVPASENVVTPHWAPYISHDIPFADGVSGEISFKIEAKSDIFISNGKENTGQKGELLFSHYCLNGEKKYFIPATTLKGMTRNLVEILSFGALKKGVVNNNNKFAIRSISNKEYSKEVPKRRLQSGYLFMKNGNYFFRPVKSGQLSKENKKSNLNADRFDEIYKKREYKINSKGKIVQSLSDLRGINYYVFEDSKNSQTLSVPQSIIAEFSATYSTLSKPNLKDHYSKAYQALVNGYETPLWAIVEDNRVLHFGLAPEYQKDGKQGSYVPGISKNPYVSRQLVTGFLQAETIESENGKEEEKEEIYFFTPAKEGRINSKTINDYNYKSGTITKCSSSNGYVFRPTFPDGQKGFIVITGPIPGKKAEYVFFKDNRAQRIQIGKTIVTAFKNAYSYSKSENNAPQNKTAIEDYDKKWEQRLNKSGYGMPVWATVENGEVKHFGLSTNYRVESNIDVHKATDNAQTPTSKPDLAECIFGYIAAEEVKNPKTHHFLRGRVHFHSAPAIGPVKPVEKPVEATLSTPSPSFYPSYLQDGATYLNEEAKISGWKRYPIKKEFYDGKKEDNSNGTQDMKVEFTPLEAGATFSASLHFHNLRPVELGALLSALTLHGTMKKKGVYYNIGMGKPLGLGKIKLSEPELKVHLPDYDKRQKKLSTDYNHYLQVFEAYMNAVTNQEKPTWHKSPSVTQLCAMCQEADDSKLEYLKLTDGGTAKNKGWYFDPYPTEGKEKVDSLIEEEQIGAVRQQVEFEQDLKKNTCLTHEQKKAIKTELLRWYKAQS